MPVATSLSTPWCSTEVFNSPQQESVSSIRAHLMNKHKSLLEKRQGTPQLGRPSPPFYVLIHRRQVRCSYSELLLVIVCINMNHMNMRDESVASASWIIARCSGQVLNRLKKLKKQPDHTWTRMLLPDRSQLSVLLKRIRWLTFISASFDQRQRLHNANSSSTELNHRLAF